MTSTKERDMQLWATWKRTQAPRDLQALLDQMQPLLAREVSKWAPSVSRGLLEAEAKRLAVLSFQQFDPNRGVALSTFLASRIVKISRICYGTQNAARMSETNAVSFGAFHAAASELRDLHGREPSVAELADHMGWSMKRVGDFQRQANNKEFIESDEGPSTEDDGSDFTIDLIYHDLSPMQQKIFEYSSGYRGAPILDGKQTMKKLGITQGQLSYQKTLLVKAIEAARGKRG